MSKALKEFTSAVKTAAASSNEPLSAWQLAMEKKFMEAVAMNLKAPSIRCKVVGIGVAMLSFDGEDKSDLSFEGYASMIVKGYDVIVNVEIDHVMRGKIKEEKSYKIGVVRPSTIADLIRGDVFGSF